MKISISSLVLAALGAASLAAQAPTVSSKTRPENNQNAQGPVLGQKPSEVLQLEKVKGTLRSVNVETRTVVIDPGKVDRSPTGTGCSARMAVLHAEGRMQAGDRMIGRSIIDSRFDCAIVEETRVGGRPAIVPSIRGRAWISGTHQLMLDPDDPWPQGYRLSDTWPVKPG